MEKFQTQAFALQALDDAITQKLRELQNPREQRTGATCDAEMGGNLWTRLCGDLGKGKKMLGGHLLANDLRTSASFPPTRSKSKPK